MKCGLSSLFIVPQIGFMQKEKHVNRMQYVFHIVKMAKKRSSEPTREDKIFQKILYFCLLCCVFCVAAFLLTGLSFYGRLLYGTMLITIIVGIIAIIWRIRDINNK